jgi:hypothetical protein
MMNYFFKFDKKKNMEIQNISEQQRKMRALWFARTLHDNKKRIQAGFPKMNQQDYDNAWLEIQKEFKEK